MKHNLIFWPYLSTHCRRARAAHLCADLRNPAICLHALSAAEVAANSTAAPSMGGNDQGRTNNKKCSFTIHRLVF